MKTGFAVLAVRVAILARDEGVTRVPGGKLEIPLDWIRIQPVQDLLGSVQFPEKVEPAGSTIVSPQIEELMAVCSPVESPATTFRTVPPWVGIVRLTVAWGRTGRAGPLLTEAEKVKPFAKVACCPSTACTVMVTLPAVSAGVTA